MNGTAARRAPAWCGIAGPAAFVGAWAIAGALRSPAYSPVSQAISQLARSGTPTRPLMTAGFVVFGLVMPVYAAALGRALGSVPVRVATTGTGLATLAVAALPLSAAANQPVDTWHAAAAAAGYACQILAPLLAGRVQAGRDRKVSYVVAGVAAAGLVGSVLLPQVTGLLQRTGLTVVDVWFVVAAVRLLRTAG